MKSGGRRTEGEKDGWRKVGIEPLPSRGLKAGDWRKAHAKSVKVCLVRLFLCVGEWRNGCAVTEGKMGAITNLFEAIACRSKSAPPFAVKPVRCAMIHALGQREQLGGSSCECCK